MRAIEIVQKMCSEFSVHETLRYSLDALNFLSMAGIFDESNASALAMMAAISQGTTLDNETLLKATEAITDTSIEFILKYPDLEYTENTMDMLSLQKTCPIKFIEHVHFTATVKAGQDQTILSPNTTTLGEVATPRITNKSTSEVFEMMYNGKQEMIN
jgi:hypothetical protein